MAQTPDTQANMRWLPHVNVITPLLRLHRLSLAAAAAVAAPTPGAGCQLLSPSTPPHRAALLSRFGQGLSLSLCTCTPPICAPQDHLLFCFCLSIFSICVSVLLLLPQALTRHLSPGALPVLYEPALVKFYCAAASALTETILMQKNPLRSALDPSWPSPICKSL